MSAPFDLVVRNARGENGVATEIGIRSGRIAAIAPRLAVHGPEYDAGAATVAPGLHDHHLHLLATAARMASVDLQGCSDADEAIARLRTRAGGANDWVRAIGYDETIAGLPDRLALDTWLPDRPLRIQDRTGAYWLLNSRAVAQLGAPPYPDCVELAADGAPNGRVRRGDAWLRERIGGTAPDLVPLGAQLARWGITGVTDASASNGAVEAGLIAGKMPQRLTLMGTEALPPGNGYALGPVKLLFDEDALPPVQAVAARISHARELGKNVAAHCVTLGELVFYLEALAHAGGARAGDRIEHGGIIAESLIVDIAALGLTVVTQPNFIHDRGDRYRAQIEPGELDNLYRLGSLLRAGVAVLGGSDAPYGDADPWVAIRAATNRRTRDGAIIGKGEAIGRAAALALYRARPLVIGAPADLIVYDWPDESHALTDVRLTVIGGVIAWQA